MSKQNTHIERTVGKIPFTEGGTERLDLPKDHFYEQLNLLVNWDITVNTAGTGENGFGLLELVDDISVKFNGNKTPKSQSLAMSHMADWYRAGTRPVFDDIDLSSATQQTGQVQTYVNFLLREGLIGTMMPSFAFSSLSLEVKWGTASDIADDVTINDASIEVQTKERRKSAVKNPNAFVKNKAQVFQEAQQAQTIDQDGTITVDLTTEGKYVAIPIQVLDNDAPDLTGLIEEIELVDNGVNTHRVTNPDFVRADNFQTYSVEQLAPGFAILRYGIRDSEAFNANGKDSYELKLTTAKAPTSPARVEYLEQTIV